ncbi:MAG: YdbL family protein, partial [Candidatus Omnitrophica bacterium]|nr:YdbL family protein [Candidatus Omnitrophota bacterium]
MRIFVLICLVALPIMLVSPGSVWAKEYNIKQMTAEVTVALENRRERYDRLMELKKKGVVGENNKGYVSVLKHDPQVAELVKAENKDRKVIYQTIADQNGLIDAIGVV